MKIGSDVTLTGIGIAFGTSEAICGASKSAELLQVRAKQKVQVQQTGEEKATPSVMLTAGLKVKSMSGVTFYAQAIIKLNGEPACEMCGDWLWCSCIIMNVYLSVFYRLN